MATRKPLQQTVLLWLVWSLAGQAHASKNSRTQSRTRADDEASTRIIDGRVIGGVDALPGRYPYFVLFPERPCGGSLIAPDIVLTAAHCMGELVTAQVGRYDLGRTDDTFEEFNLIQEVAHPLWENSIPLYDVMLVKISGQSTSPLLAINNNLNLPSMEGERLTLMGFDFDILGEVTDTTILQEVDVGYIPNDICEQLEDPFISVSLDGLVTEQWLCADEEDRGICFGDAGNPLILPGSDSTQDIQVGLAAANFGCENNVLPDVYTRMEPNYEWIASAVCDLSDAPPDSFNCFPSIAPTSQPIKAPVTPQPITSAPTSSPTEAPVSPKPTTPTTPQPASPPPNLSRMPSQIPSSMPVTTTPVAIPTSPQPTSLPTQSPITNTPVETPTRDTPAPVASTVVEVEVFIHFDDFPPETGWSITRIATGEIVANVEIGTYEILMDSVTEVVSLLSVEEYAFLIEDLFGDGMCCAMPGSYLVRQNGVELVMGGGDFGSSEETMFTTMLPDESAPPVTPSPVTPVPTDTPVTPSPVTPIPTAAPATPSPVTSTPTDSPTAPAPVTPLPTGVPPVTSSPGTPPVAPITSPPTDAPVTPSPETPVPTGKPVTPAPSDEPLLMNIFDTLNSSGQFPTLVVALMLTGLADELESPGPFTLFAPTEEAFDKLPAGVLDLLLCPEYKETLTEILLYHVVSGIILSSDISDGDKAMTVQGGNVTFSVCNEGIEVNNVTIIFDNVLADNGVIHVIDEVLIPDGLVLPELTLMPSGAPTKVPVQAPTTSSPSRPPATLAPTKRPPSLDYPLETLPPENQPGSLSIGAIVVLDLDLIFEYAPGAIGWSVRNTRTDIIVAHRPIGPVPTFHPDLYESISLLWGQHYEFVLEEEDGECCDVPVSYKLSWGESVIVAGEVERGDEVRASFSLADPATETVPQEDYTIYDAHPSLNGEIIAGLQLDLVFLEDPKEIGWSVRNVATGNIVDSRAITPLPMNQLDLHQTISLLRGQTYEFVLEEPDGNCCSVSVSYKLSEGDTLIVEGVVNAGDEVKATFSLESTSAEALPQAEYHQSSSTFAPLQIGNADKSVGGIIVDIILDFSFQGDPAEIVWHLQNTATGNVLAFGPIVSLPPGHGNFQQTIALMRGQSYDFVLEEENGLCCNIPVSYTISKGDTVLVDEDAGSGEMVRSTFALD